MSERHSAIKSFGYAGNGLREAFKNEPNFRAHTGMAIISLVLGLFLHLSIAEFAILIITIFFVIALELVNTLIEKIVDIISPQYSPQAKVIKDVSAACVLIAAFASVLVGILIFLPKILQLLSGVIH